MASSSPDAGAGTAIGGFAAPRHPGVGMMVDGSSPREGAPRILIVEDDTTLTGLFREYLDGEGVEFTLASTVVEAEAYLSESHFDLLLLDISLPGEDGLSFYRRARSRLPRTLFMSAIDRLLHAGNDIPSDSWLPKPFGPEELSRRIHECLGPGRAAQASASPRPDHLQAAASMPGASATEPGSASPHVLLVEDDPVLSEMIAELLAWSGFRVTRASRISEAEEALKANPDVVVMDGMLPDGDGRDLIREIRARPTRTRLPVLMLSGRSSSADETASLDAGADDHLSKPFTEEELVARLNLLLKLPARPPA